MTASASKAKQNWARIMVPMGGTEADAGPLAAAAAIAAVFDAELAALHAPAEVSELVPWIGDGFIGGGAPISALDMLREVAIEGARAARALSDSVAYERKTFATLESPVWAALGFESRLSDLVVFGAQAAGRGPSPLGDAFRQVLANEQRPVLIADGPVSAEGVIAIAWDGGKEATRAIRTALPLLQRAREVVVLSAAEATPRKFEPERMVDFLSARGVASRLLPVGGRQDVAQRLLAAAHSAGAEILAAGAFGHPRLQEFVFGGVTRDLLSATERPALFLSH